MVFQPNQRLTNRVERAALALLERDGRLMYPTLLRELGILAAQDLDAWRRGRVPYLEKVTRGAPIRRGGVRGRVHQTSACRCQPGSS